MSKTIRELSALTKRVDVFFIVLDARAPISSYISQFDEIVKHRQKVILINKADLVDKNQLAKFVKHYKENFEYVFTISIKDKKKVKKDMLDILGKIKFTKMIPKIGILGIPNVGKSTLLNILTEGTPAKVEDRAGVTKHIS
ncbi:MAG: hypothetical protein DRP42_03390 [Tenericutes bacterium]|nr:MAG: hypothetical protein DRP42_03390 [Mycoplasmatota bacterium]